MQKYGYPSKMFQSAGRCYGSYVEKGKGRIGRNPHSVRTDNL
jgi:hypothetical protein